MNSFKKSSIYNWYNWIKRHLDALSIFLASGCIFLFVSLFANSDIAAHIGQIATINSGDASYPSNFLFYWITNLISGFSQTYNVTLWVGVGLLSTATVMKYQLSKLIIGSLFKSLKFDTTSRLLAIISLALFFCFAIAEPYSVIVLKRFYLGKFVPAVWHNSTTIFLFPFAILLFWKQIKYLSPDTFLKTSEIIALHLLVLINVFIKPSFIFVYLPVTGILLLAQLKHIGLRELIIKASPLITGLVGIAFQFVLIYIKEMGNFQKEQSHVALSAPFEFISLWIPSWYIPISLITSFALPIGAMIAYKEIMKFEPFRYAGLLTIVGILISAFIYETGPRLDHGNFTWQNVICTFLLFLSTVAFIVPKILRNRSWKEWTMISLFTLHSGSGILYLANIFFRYSYY